MVAPCILLTQALRASFRVSTVTYARHGSIFARLTRTIQNPYADLTRAYAAHTKLTKVYIFGGRPTRYCNFFVVWPPGNMFFVSLTCPVHRFRRPPSGNTVFCVLLCTFRMMDGGTGLRALTRRLRAKRLQARRQSEYEGPWVPVTSKTHYV